MCCVYAGYHAVVSHVKLNHDTFATDNQRLKLSIRSAQKTWSVFAEAFSASTRDFGICTPKFSLAAIINLAWLSSIACYRTLPPVYSCGGRANGREFCQAECSSRCAVCIKRFALI